MDGQGISGHGIDGSSGHGMAGRPRSGHEIRAATHAPMSAATTGTTIVPTPPTTWRAAWRRGLARIFSSRTAAGDPGSGTRSMPPVPMRDAAVAASRLPSNHVARMGWPRVVKRTRNAPAPSARSCPVSAARKRESSTEDFCVAISSPSIHHVARLLQSPTDVSTWWCRPPTLSS